MSKNALAASLFFLSLIAADSVWAQEIDPARLKEYYSIPLDFDGKRVKSRPDVPVNFDNGKKAATWKGIVQEKSAASKAGFREGTSAKFTLHWGADDDVIWVNEIQEFEEDVLSRMTTFEKGQVNNATFCRGKKLTLFDKLSSVEMNCTTSNRYTCDALFTAFPAEMKNSQSEMYGKSFAGVADMSLKCSENIPKKECDAKAKKEEEQKCKDKVLEKKCAVLADSYQRIFILLKQEAAKTQKEIQADIHRTQSKMDEVLGKWGRAVVTSVTSEKSQEKMLESLKNPAKSVEVMGHINNAMAQCMRTHKDLNNIKVKAAAGSSSAPVKVAPQGGQK